MERGARSNKASMASLTTGSSEDCNPDASALELLPANLLQTILAKLDVPSLCCASATCRAFNVCAIEIFSFIPTFHLLDIAPTIDLLRSLLPPNPYLRSMKIDCSNLDDSAISHLVRPSLQELTLQSCEKFSGKLLSQLGRQCKDLRSLFLGSLAEQRGCTVLISELVELLSGCSELEALSLLLDMSAFSSHNFAQIWSLASRKLVALEIGYIPLGKVNELLHPNMEAQQPAYQMHQSVMPNLQKLCLSVDYITDSLVSTISQGLVSLAHLDLHDSPIVEPDANLDLTNSGLQQINRHRKLKCLSLVRSQEYLATFFRRVNDLGVLMMADSCSNLESIHLGGFCRITDTGFRAILHSCPNLHRLKVWRGIQLTDLMFHDISATSLSLTHVSLRWCNLLTNSAIMRLTSNKDLGVLDLRHCRNIGDEALGSILGLPRLKILLLDGCDISDVGLSHMEHGMDSLVSLSVRGCKRLTAKCISAIFSGSVGQTLQILDLSNIPNLSDDGILLLAKSGVPIVELRLRECPLIGDISVIALASMRVKGGSHGSSLRLLDLYNCGGITRLAIRWFKKPYFPRLRWLGVTGCVNRDMVDALARSRPFLHVVCRGQELGPGCSDSSYGLYKGEYEEVDELEQWLLEGEDERDEIMGED